MLQSQLNGVLCLQESQTIRLQRLIQQRKRMEHMSVLLQQQNDTIAILKRQNQSINKQFYEVKVQNELINDKLIVSCNHAEDLTDLIMKQSSLIETLKQALFGNYHIDQYQRGLLLQEIQQSLSVYQTIKSGAFSAQNKHFKDEIQRLNQQNQQWQQKYQDLCQNYLQVTKHCKLLEFQNMRHKNTVKKQNSQEKNTQKPQNSQECSNCKLILQNNNQNNQQIIKLKKFIEQKKVQISLKDKLIEQHRKNEKQQKKLLKFLKEKFNQEGRQLSQIAKSTQNIDISPLSRQQVMTYEVINNGDKVSQSYFIPNHTLEQKTLNVNPTFGNITASKVASKMGKSKVKIVEVNSVSKHDVTSSKKKVNSSTVKDDRSSLLMNELSPDSGFKKTVSKCLIQP